MKKSSTAYVAFLRGINVGGSKKVPMADLKRMLEGMGYQDVKTLLASGNVVFETEAAPATLKKTFETTFEETFGFTSSVIIRTRASVAALVKADPFRDVAVTPETRLYVTFLPEKATGTLSVPHSSADGSFRILSRTKGELFSVLTLSEEVGTTDAMEILDKAFGKTITTRNWNTVQKLIK